MGNHNDKRYADLASASFLGDSPADDARMAAQELQHAPEMADQDKIDQENATLEFQNGSVTWNGSWNEQQFKGSKHSVIVTDDDSDEAHEYRAYADRVDEDFSNSACVCPGYPPNAYHKVWCDHCEEHEICLYWDEAWDVIPTPGSFVQLDAGAKHWLFHKGQWRPLRKDQWKSANSYATRWSKETGDLFATGLAEWAKINLVTSEAWKTHDVPRQLKVTEPVKGGITLNPPGPDTRTETMIENAQRFQDECRRLERENPEIEHPQHPSEAVGWIGRPGFQA